MEEKVLDRWWMQQGFTRILPDCHQIKARGRTNIKVGENCLLNLDNGAFRIYRLCRVLRNKTSTTGRIRKNRTGYEWEEISAGARKLVFLGPNPGMELLKTSSKFDFGMLETSCLGHLRCLRAGQGCVNALPRRRTVTPEDCHEDRGHLTRFM